MNTLRTLPRFIVGSFAAVTLLVTMAFAISNEELAALSAKAQTGSGIAQYNLGLIYANPQEPIANPIEAYVWLNLASDNGATGKALVLLNSQLTPEQISEGQRLLEQRRADLAAHRAIAIAAPAVKTSAPVNAAPVNPVSPVVAVVPVAIPVISAPSEAANPGLQTALDKSNNDLAAIAKENEQLKTQLAKASQDSTALEQVKKDRDQLAATVEANTNEISTMRAAAANFEGERNALQQKIATAAQQKQDGIAAELAATKANLKTAENELAKATMAATQLADARTNLASLNSELQKLTAENQRLDSLVKQADTTAESKHSASEKTINEISGELMKTQATLADMTTKAAAAASATAELTNLRQQNADLAAQLQKTSVGNEQAAKAASDALQQIADLSSKLKSADEAVVSAAAERHDLSQQIAALKAAPKSDPVDTAKIAELTALLETTRAQASEQRETLTVRVKTSEDALAKATTENTDLQEKLAAAKPSRKEKIAQAKIDELTAALEAARAEAVKNQENASQLATAKTEITDLQAKLKSSDEALSAAKAAPAATVATGEPTAPAEDQPDQQKEIAELQMKLDASLRSFQLQQNEIDRLQKTLASIDDERAQIAEKLQTANTEAANATAKAAVNDAAAAQLAGMREQLRQTQNQLASIAYENAELKHRVSVVSPGTAVSMPTIAIPVPSPSLGTPNRPGLSAPAAASAPATAPRVHTVVSGDNLSTIAKRYYGNGNRWTEILEANRGTLKDPGALKVGMKLKIP